MKNTVDKFMLHFSALTIAVGVMTSGCATEPGDLSDDGIEEPGAPDDTVTPDEPDAPEQTCGTHYVEVEGDFPVPPYWTGGHPFTIGDYVGYADVVTATFFSGLMLRIFDQDGPGVREHWLHSYDLRGHEPGSFASFQIHDILVNGDLVHILWRADLLGPNGSPDPFPAHGLTTIIPSLDLVDTAALPQLMWENNPRLRHRLAVDEEGHLHLGSYDYLTGELSHRPFVETVHGYAFAWHESNFVHQLGDIWRFSVLNDFAVENGALKYLVGGPYRAASVTHRACD